MKIAITGTSSGIGLAVKNLLETEHEIISLDITDGYTIDDLSIVKHILGADVFINNAYSREKPASQQKLFEAVHSEWQHYNKHIINIGSLSKYYNLETLRFPEYTNAKKALNEAHCKALLQKERKNIITQICPGYTDTLLIGNLDVPKMNPHEVALAVEYCIKMAAEGIEIADFTLSKVKS